MTINLTPPQYRIWVCKPDETEADGLEVTEACIGEEGGYFSVTDSPIDEGGLFLAAGQLVLVPIDNFLESFDPWQNPARWAIGNRVIVRIQLVTGQWVYHPRSGLRVTKIPAPPTPNNNQLALQLGCELVYKNSRSPDGDKSQMSFGVSVARAGTLSSPVNQYLAAAGLQIAGGIGLFPLTYPCPKTSGSYVQTAGAIAIGGMCGLWARQDGIIATQFLNLKPASRLLKVVVGKQEVDFEPLTGDETPCELVSAVGVGYKSVLAASFGETISEEFDIKESVQPGGGTDVILVEQTRETWERTTRAIVRKKSVKRARGLSLSNGFFEDLGIEPADSPYTLRFAEEAEEVDSFESGNQGRQLQTKIVSKQPRGVVLRDYYLANPPSREELQSIAWFQSVTASEQTITFSYSSGTQTERIADITLKPKGTIAASAEDWKDNQFGLLRLTTAESTTKSWLEVRPKEWQFRELIRRSGRIRRGSIAALCSASLVSDKKAESRSGDTQPPAANVIGPEYDRQEVQYEGQARFKVAGVASQPQGQILQGVDLGRRHTYQFDYCVSDEQMEQLAKLFGQMRLARHQGFRVVTPFLDSLVNYRPFARIDVEFNGSLMIGIADSVTWTLAANEAIVVFDCMRIGGLIDAFGNPTATDSYPPNPNPDPEAISTQSIASLYAVRQQFKGGIGMGGEFQRYLYQVGAKPSVDMKGGIGMGGWLALRLPEKDFKGGIGTTFNIVPRQSFKGGIGMGGSISSNTGGGGGGS